jgi:putative flippase GtrA
MLSNGAKVVAINLISSRFIRFSGVGTVGFIVDSAVLYFMVYIAGFNLFAGRIISYLFAATTTWFLNRNFTFTDSKRSQRTRQWFKFLLVNTAGGIVNYAVYAGAIIISATVANHPIIGVALGSLSGLIVNYTASRLLVFPADTNS